MRLSKDIEIYHYEGTYKFFYRSEVVEDRRPDSGFPAHSTDIRPPFEDLRQGEIPVFNGIGWDIVIDNFWRPKHRDENYDAGRPSGTYRPLGLSMIGGHFPPYPSMPMLCNSALVVTSICQRLRYIHAKFDTAIDFHRQALELFPSIPLDIPHDPLSLASQPTHTYMYKLEIESLVYTMRKVLDSLLQLSYLLTNYADFEATKEIPVNEIGHILMENSRYSDLKKIFIGAEDEGYAADKTGFLRIINDVFNSFKHCLMHDESYSLVTLDVPFLTSYQAKHNKHQNEIVRHHHNLYHVMMGFQDTVLRILKNQANYLLKNPKSS
ncbi:hypothetical protein [Herbaspirillum huttiense]|uniref:Uncharacterized protein n=1 Tax=Herbaspirillum huttiense subsp. lycopersici TaxID=3074428 RepID=A0ABU2EPF6_9BURK|nr:hypothetical protein [Herbaspirillum huttiense]MDR9849717.1 hypothetical protein [Herbaspirillum huttiense SE1]